jgi:hypothetical protein
LCTGIEPGVSDHILKEWSDDAVHRISACILPHANYIEQSQCVSACLSIHAKPLSYRIDGFTVAVYFGHGVWEPNIPYLSCTILIFAKVLAYCQHPVCTTQVKFDIVLPALAIQYGMIGLNLTSRTPGRWARGVDVHTGGFAGEIRQSIILTLPSVPAVAIKLYGACGDQWPLLSGYGPNYNNNVHKAPFNPIN